MWAFLKVLDGNKLIKTVEGSETAFFCSCLSSCVKIVVLLDVEFLGLLKSPWWISKAILLLDVLGSGFSLPRTLLCTTYELVS